MERATLTETQAALARQTRPPDEILIIRDVERRGPAWARNQAIRGAHGDLIAFTDDDVVPADDWLEQLIRAIDEHDAAGVGGPYRETDELLRSTHYKRSLPTAEQVDTGGFVGNAANLMIRREWLQACETADGYIFNESFRHGGEDHELTLRLRLLGARLIFTPMAPLHLHRVTPAQFLVRQFTRGMGIADLFRVQNVLRPPVAPMPSLLWTNDGMTRGPRWLRVLWHRVLGPFDIQRFTSVRSFAWIWLGEKAQGAGFLWAMARHVSRGHARRR